MRPITIIGGGVSGLALGIGLRQRGIPVTVWEAGQYPRHRVCGEFISGRGQEVLGRLGVEASLRGNDAFVARTAAFFSDGSVTSMKLPEAALSYSRFGLDWLLAGKFREQGGELKERCRWIGSFEREGVVRATGRRMHRMESGWRWIGLKAHVTGVDLRADLELHFRRDAYVGVCRIEKGRVNVCGLFRSSVPIRDLQRDWPRFLQGDEGSELHHLLGEARFEPDSFCSVAGLSFRPVWVAGDELLIGDALSVIAPFTGNGISMALESADLGVEALERYSQRQIEWNVAVSLIREKLARRFRNRLRTAWWIQHGLFRSAVRRLLFPFFARHGWIRRWFFYQTR